MKSLPELPLDYGPLARILYGAIPAKALLTAIELKVFSQLTTPTSADAVADRLGTHRKNTRLLLDAMAANELLHKRAGQYWNTPLADTFLVEGRPTYLGDVFRNLTEYMRPALEHMTALVRTGDSPPVRFSDPSLEERETQIYGNYQRAGRAQHTAAMIAKLPEFPDMSRMLDLGGAAGLIGLAIVAAHPTMTGVIFDQPEVVEVTRQFIREYELEDRVTVIGGDYCEDAIGDAYDLVWTSFAIRRGDLDAMLRKILAALNPGGLCVSLAEGLTDEGTRPTLTVNSMLAVALRSDEPLYEEGEVAQAMLRVGFSSVHSRIAPGPQPHGPAIVDIGRK